MARLLTLILGFTAVLHLNAAREAILRPGEDATLQCTDNNVIVPEGVRYESGRVPDGEDCVLESARVDVITGCTVNRPECKVTLTLADDCARGTEDIIVKYECVDRSKLITACSGEREVDGNVPPFYWVTPNYPLSYDGLDSCDIKVNTDSSKTYKVSFLDLEMEARDIGTPGCYDKVVISNEQVEVYTYTYCGRFASVKTGENLVREMQHLKMTLYTDGQTHMRGVLIKVEETTPSSTTTTTTSTTTTTTAPPATTKRPGDTSSSTTVSSTKGPTVSTTKGPTASTTKGPTASSTTAPTKPVQDPTEKSTLSSSTGNPVTQPSFDDCASSPCRNNGTCIDEFGFFFCTCLLGYSGYNCEIALNATLNVCDYHPCLHGGTCENDFEMFRCECHPGYDGEVCQHIINADELRSGSGHPVGITVLGLLAIAALSRISS